MSTQENSILHDQWVQEYGTTLKYKGLFGVRTNTLPNAFVRSLIETHR